jgi:hypothetical protein
MENRTLTRGEVISMVRAYTQERFGSDPGFKGAFLIGSINEMLDDVPFPIYRDIDVGVITDQVQEMENLETSVQGYIVESVLYAPKLCENAEILLADNRYASNFAADSILLDPEDFLKPIHLQVAAEFNRRKWVTARCSDEMHEVKKALEDMKQVKNAGAYMIAFGRHVMFRTGALSCAHLRPPTHRRGLLHLRTTLANAGCADLYEELMTSSGLADITPADAEGFLQDAVDSFDRAIEVFKTPIPYAYKLEPFIRPYLLDGTRELFAENGYRESLFWIARFLIIACMVILNDGTEEEKPVIAARLARFTKALGLDTEEARQQRTAACEAFLPLVEAHIAQTLKNSPDIRD